MPERRDERSDVRRPRREGTGVPPNKVQHFLKGMSYPARKEDLVKQAHRNDAPAAVMHVIQRFPEDRDYGGPQDVMKAYGDVSNQP